MVGNFRIDDVVLYDRRLYKVKSSHALNWFMVDDPIVYGIYGIDDINSDVVIYVREELLTKLSGDIEVLKILYGC